MAKSGFRPPFPQRRRRLRLCRGPALAGGPDLPALRQCGCRPHWPPDRQVQPPRPAEVLRLPQDLHRPHRHHFRGQPFPAAPLAAGHPAYHRLEKRHFDPPDSADLRLQHEDRLVRHAPGSRIDGPGGQFWPVGGPGKTIEADDMEMGRSRQDPEAPGGWPQGPTSRC